MTNFGDLDAMDDADWDMVGFHCTCTAIFGGC